MTMNKNIILDKIKEHYNLKNNAELAKKLGIKANTISNWYKRNSIDYDIVFTKCEDMDFNLLLSDSKIKIEKANYNIEESKFVDDIKDKHKFLKETYNNIGCYNMLESIIKDSPYYSIHKKYENMVDESDSILCLLQYYSIRQKFNEIYSRFSSGNISYERMITDFNDNIKYELDLFSVISKYMQNIHDLFNEIEKFNKTNDNAYTFPEK